MMRGIQALMAGGSICCFASPLLAQLPPAGTWRAQTVTLELSRNGRATVTSASGVLIAGTYRVAQDTLVLRDESGPAACAGETGHYQWLSDGASLRLRALSDACEGRRTTLVQRWILVASPVIAEPQVLPPITTTGARVTQDLQRAAIAATVIQGDAVRDAGVTRTQDLTYLTPGLLVGRLLGQAAMIYLRGVGNFGGSSLQDPTVTFNVDGVYIARQTSTSGAFFDLERVEVLKGPQGTLYGRNATGGAINVLTRRPQLSVLGGGVSADYGEHNTLRVDGGVNLPLGTRSAIRFAGQRFVHDPYMQDGTDDQDDWSARLSFRHEASDNLSLRLSADYYDQRGHGPGATPLALDRDSRFGVGSPEGVSYYQSQRVTIAGRNFLGVPAIAREANRHAGISGTAEWRTGLGTFTAVSAWRDDHLDAVSTQSGNLFSTWEDSRQLSLETRLASSPLPRLHTVVGLFGFDEEIDILTRPFNQFNFSLQHPLTGVTSLAAFGRVTWDVTDRARATLGARYTHEDKYFRGSFQSFSRICPPPPTGQCPNAEPFPTDIMEAPLSFAPGSATATTVFNPATGTLTTGARIAADTGATFKRTTWRAAAEYDLAESAFLFASYETGFKAGGFFHSHDSPIYQPEHLGALTLGFKSRLFGNRLQANVELFDWRYKDQQVAKLSVDSKQVTNLRVENVGKATIRGVETDLEFAPATNTRLSANLQYLDATYDSYVYQTPQSSGLPVSGCTVTPVPGGGGYEVDCSGRRAPFAPEWTIGLGAMQAVELRNGAILLARTRARYQSETLMGIDFLTEQHQNGYWMLDASLTLSSSGDRYAVGVFGQNLTDETVLSNTFVVPFSRFAVAVLRPPRTVGVRVEASF